MAAWPNPIIDPDDIQIWFTGDAGGTPKRPPKGEKILFVAQYNALRDEMLGRWYPLSEAKLWLSVMKRFPFLPGSSPDGVIING